MSDAFKSSDALFSPRVGLAKDSVAATGGAVAGGAVAVACVIEFGMQSWLQP